MKMTTKSQGWTNRQKDTGWGYAFAHWIPFVWAYYSITRRTITPLLYNLLGQVIIVLCCALIFDSEDPNIEKKIGILSAPFLVKLGINSARKDGYKRLGASIDMERSRQDQSKSE